MFNVMKVLWSFEDACKVQQGACVLTAAVLTPCTSSFLFLKNGAGNGIEEVLDLRFGSSAEIAFHLFVYHHGGSWSSLCGESFMFWCPERGLISPR